MYQSSPSPWVFLVLPVVWAVLLWILPVVVTGQILRHKCRSFRWLWLGLIPFSGLLLLLVALLLPDRSEVRETPSIAPSAGWGLIVLDTVCLLAACLLSTESGQQLLSGRKSLPGIDRAQIVAGLQNEISSHPAFASQRDVLGDPQIISVSELAHDPIAETRRGRVTVRHKLGDEEFLFRVAWKDQQFSEVAVELEPMALPEATLPRVQSLLRSALLATPPYASRQPELGSVEILAVNQTAYQSQVPRREGWLRIRHAQGEEQVRFVLQFDRQRPGSLEARFEEPELPTVHSAQVTPLLLQAIEGSVLVQIDRVAGEQLEILKLEELTYDSQKQFRQAKAMIKYGDLFAPVHFRLDWRDRSRGSLRVRIDPPQIPPIDHPAVRTMLRQRIEGSPFWIANRQILGSVEIQQITELQFNEVEQRRVGRAKIRVRDASHEFDFALMWQDRTRNLFTIEEVNDPAQLPQIESIEIASRVKTLLEYSIARFEGGARKEEIQLEKLVQVSYDSDVGRRFGRARIRPAQDADAFEIDFLVHWADQNKTCWDVQLKSPELPALDSAVVLHQLKHSISDSSRFASRRDQVENLEITSARDVVFDNTSQRRVGRAQVQHALGKEEVKVAIRWHDHQRGIWEVEVLEE